MEKFRDALALWSRSSPAESGALRSYLNNEASEVHETVRLSGCLGIMKILAPPITGHPPVTVDPFDHLFEAPYDVNMIRPVIDMLEKAIGVIRSGKFGEHKGNILRMRSKGRSSDTKVFLVHGHDDSARESTARFLEKLGLEVVILHEQPSSGKTIIEKIEKYSNVAFRGGFTDPG